MILILCIKYKMKCAVSNEKDHLYFLNIVMYDGEFFAGLLGQKIFGFYIIIYKVYIDTHVHCIIYK